MKERKRSSQNGKRDKSYTINKYKSPTVWGMLNADGSSRCDKSRSTLFTEAVIKCISCGNTPLVESLLASKQVKMNQGDQNGITPLIMAPDKGYAGIVKNI